MKIRTRYSTHHDSVKDGDDWKPVYLNGRQFDSTQTFTYGIHLFLVDEGKYHLTCGASAIF